MNSGLVKKIENSLVIDDETNINKLNDDCLQEIFKYLSVKEKLIIEFVCKRWEVIGNLIWSDFKSLDVLRVIYENFSETQNKNLTDFILRVVKRSHLYLNTLIIQENNKKNPCRVNYKVLFREISNQCHDLTSVTVSYVPCSDEDLDLLFKNNPKISYLVLRGLLLQGSCLLSLCGDSIVDLKFVNTIFEWEDHIYFLLTKVKNIVNICFLAEDLTYDLDRMVDSLKISKCKNIREFTVGCLIINFFQECSKNMSDFFSEQKNLRNLDVPMLETNADFLQSLPANSIEELSIKCNIPFAFYRFENLKLFECLNDYLSDEFVKNLAKCKNLEEVSLSAWNDTLTSNSEIYFAKFEQLKSFKFITESTNIDPVLFGISECKNLQKIELGSNKFSKEAVNRLSILSNLRILNITENVLNEDEILNIIIKLRNLEEIFFTAPKNFGADFLKKINSLKIERGDTHVLEVTVTMRKINFKILTLQGKDFDFTFSLLHFYILFKHENTEEDSSDEE